MGKLFSYASIKGNVDEFMSELELPSMKKPLGFGQEYEFPTSVEQIKSDRELGNLQLRLGAYLTYTQSVLGTEEMSLGVLEPLFDFKLNLAVEQVVSEKLSDGLKAPTKEVARNLALDSNEDLKKIWVTLLEKKAKITLLKSQAEIYNQQLIRLSREQSRRERERE